MPTFPIDDWQGVMLKLSSLSTEEWPRKKPDVIYQMLPSPSLAVSFSRTYRDPLSDCGLAGIVGVDDEPGAGEGGAGAAHVTRGHPHGGSAIRQHRRRARAVPSADVLQPPLLRRWLLALTTKKTI